MTSTMTTIITTLLAFIPSQIAKTAFSMATACRQVLHTRRRHVCRRLETSSTWSAQNGYHSMKLNSRNCHDMSGSSCNPITNCIYLLIQEPSHLFRSISPVCKSENWDFFFPQVRLTLATQVKQRRLPMFGVHINSQDPKWQWPRHWKAWTPIHLWPAKKGVWSEMTWKKLFESNLWYKLIAS